MAKRISLKRHFYDRIPDWIWPHLTGDAEPAPKDNDHFNTKHSGLLDEVNSVLSTRLAQTDERVRNVESKLMALLTLTSVLSVVVATGLAAVTTLGTVGEEAETKIFAWVAVVLISYVAVQLIRALGATVAGLMRRSYRQLSPEDMVPEDNETSETFRTRLLNLQVNSMRFNEWVVNQKVSEMAVAHEALRNALVSTFVLILLGLVTAIVHLV